MDSTRKETSSYSIRLSKKIKPNGKPKRCRTRDRDRITVSA